LVEVEDFSPLLLLSSYPWSPLATGTTNTQRQSDDIMPFANPFALGIQKSI